MSIEELGCELVRPASTREWRVRYRQQPGGLETYVMCADEGAARSFVAFYDEHTPAELAVESRVVGEWEET